ncbi:MAG: right-handed parallel beta-helix repeat-containing protein, partial [Actinomycetota bacterium]|nr:right-handed parallel beta-helix repeat-containing protein [Actinomycetota bacterium]
CPTGHGLVVVGSNIVLDLNGFQVKGLNSVAEETVGVLLRGVTGVTVKNGTVSGFDAGVVNGRGSGNTVEGLTLRENIGNHSNCGFGDGLATFNSSYNVIRNNTIERNGPFSGISVVGPSTGNAVRDNRVGDNSLLGVCGRPDQDIGIRIEGPGATGNTVSGNVVERNGIAGIALHSTLKADPPNLNNTVADNRAAENGVSGGGHGIAMLPNGALSGVNRASANVIKGNTVVLNASDGILVGNGSVDNSLLKNSGSANGRYDASDGNAGCDNNSWVHSNTFVTVNQPCVLGNPNAGPKKDEPELDVLSGVISHVFSTLL